MHDSQGEPAVSDEIQKTYQLFSGLFYYLSSTGFLNTDSEIKQLVDYFHKLDSREYREQVEPSVALEELRGLLERFKERAKVLKVEEKDITDEKLIDCVLMQSVELADEEREMRESIKEGKTPKQIAVDLFKRKIH